MRNMASDLDDVKILASIFFLDLKTCKAKKGALNIIYDEEQFQGPLIMHVSVLHKN